jgi:hypothetical protein
MSCCSAQNVAQFAIFGCEVPRPGPGTNRQALTTTCPEGGLKEKKGRSGERTAQV